MRPIVLTRAEPAAMGAIPLDGSIRFQATIGIWVRPDGSALVDTSAGLSTIKTATREAADQPDVGNLESDSEPARAHPVLQPTLVTETRESIDTTERAGDSADMDLPLVTMITKTREATDQADVGAIDLDRPPKVRQLALLPTTITQTMEALDSSECVNGHFEDYTVGAGTTMITRTQEGTDQVEAIGESG